MSDAFARELLEQACNSRDAWAITPAVVRRWDRRDLIDSTTRRLDVQGRALSVQFVALRRLPRVQRALNLRGPQMPDDAGARLHPQYLPEEDQIIGTTRVHTAEMKLYADVILEFHEH